MRLTWAGLVLAASFLCAAMARAEVRVYTDLAAFQAGTGAVQLTNPYPVFTGGALTSGPVAFSHAANGLDFNAWTGAFPGNDLAISGPENFDVTFLVPQVHAAGIEVIEPTCGSCVDSTFEIILYGNADVTALASQQELHRVTINFPDDEPAFIGFSADRRIVRIAVREISGTDDNEYFGRVYGSPHRTSSVPPGVTVRVQEFNQPIDYPVPFSQVFDFGVLPFAGAYRGVHDNGIEVIASGQQTWLHVDNSPLGTRAARQPAALEAWTLSLPPGTHAVEFELFESSQPGATANSCFSGTCFDTRYRLRAWNGPDLIRDQHFSAWNNRVNRYALWSNVPIDRLELLGEFNNSDDELLGRVRVGRQPLPDHFPQRVAAVEGSGFGGHVAVSGDFAVATDQAGFTTFQLTSGNWNRLGRRALAYEPERVAVDAAHVAVAGRNGSGVLAVHARAAGPPGTWAAPTEFAYTGTARALAIDGDVMALGVSGSVRLFLRNDGDGWQPAGELLPSPPGNVNFGLGLDLDGDLLVVGAGNDTFHVYELDANRQFVQVFHRDVVVSPGTSIVALSGQRIAQQDFTGAVTIWEAAGGVTNWSVVAVLSEPLPFTPSSGLASGLAMDGDALLARKSFFDAGAPNFREAVELWQRLVTGNWARRYVLADPHLAGDNSANLGGVQAGAALSLSGDAFWIGQSGSPWCVGPATGFFGDSGPLGYRQAACGDLGGAVFVGSLEAVSRTIFKDAFEADP